MNMEIVENIDLGKDCAEFNQRLESYFNGGPLPKSKSAKSRKVTKLKKTGK